VSEGRRLLAAHLRQRIEMGEDEAFLDALDAGTAAELVGEREESSSSRSSPKPVPDERRAPARPAAPGAPTKEEIPTAAIIETSSLHQLGELSQGCPRCSLCESRTQVVFGEGNHRAEVVVVGEAPGAEEDRTGRPFVGRAGKLLDRLLLSVGFAREEVYICNVLKCRPPKNRNPRPDEIEACNPYLVRQVELLKPRVVLACGTFAAQTLLDTATSIGRLRGSVHEYHGVPLVPTYHPAALLRNPAWGRPVWEDLQRLRRIAKGESD